MDSYIKQITERADLPPLFFRYEDDELVETNFWDDGPNALLYLAIHGNGLRLMVPSLSVGEISEMIPGAKSIYVSVLEHSLWKNSDYCVEWIVDDGTTRPWFCYLNPSCISLSGSFPTEDGAWKASVWSGVNGHPCKKMERKAHFAIVPRMPWFLPGFEQGAVDLRPFREFEGIFDKFLDSTNILRPPG